MERQAAEIQGAARCEGGYPIDGGGVVGALLERIEVAEQRVKLLLLHGRLAAPCLLLLLCSSAAGGRRHRQDATERGFSSDSRSLSRGSKQRAVRGVAPMTRPP